MRKLLFRSLGILGAAVGATLCYFAGWLTWHEIVPQIRGSGWSLTGDNLILNHNWQGNQLYLLVALYGGIGVALLLGAARLWRGPRKVGGV